MPEACPAMPLLHDLRQMAFDWCDTPAAPSGAAMPAYPPALHGAVQAAPDMQHPQSNRHIVLAHQVVGYVLRRARRRTVGMQIGESGLAVAAPAWVAQGEIDRILQHKAAWIVRKLHERGVRQADPQHQPLRWQDGTQLDCQGQPLRLRLTGDQPEGETAARPRQMRQWLAQTHLASAATETGTAELHFPLSPQADAAVVRLLAQQWFMAQAQSLFAQRVAFYEQQLGVCSRQLVLGNAASRWGSATSAGVIRLHWRLIQMEPALLDYVVVHELSHLREMNHGPRFWQIVASALPDYAERRARLKKTRLHPW